MATISPSQIGEIPYFIAKLTKASATANVVPVAIVSAGGDVTIPAGSTLAQALKIIVDAVNPT